MDLDTQKNKITVGDIACLSIMIPELLTNPVCKMQTTSHNLIKLN
jgi:hypothetical protein